MNPTQFISTTLDRSLTLLVCTAAVASLGAASPVQGGTQICDVCNVCIDYPQGALSFADQVLRYDPLAGGGPGPTAPNFIDPLRALGSPDYSSCGRSIFHQTVSLDTPPSRAPCGQGVRVHTIIPLSRRSGAVHRTHSIAAGDSCQ